MSATAEPAPRFRILSLDGGGIRGAFTASFLATLESATGRRVVDHFDLIVGTSTGGIIALALALGLPAEATRELYQRYGARIFPGTGFLQRTLARLRQLGSPKRSRARLESALLEVFGERRLCEARCRLVLPTYDAVAGRIYLLKTAHHPRLAFEHQARAVDCALATSAAPTFYAAATFPEHPGSSYLDGGVWANCPVVIGLVEASYFLGVPLESIDILSVGTVNQPFSVSRRRRLGGALAWSGVILELLMRGQTQGAVAVANLLTRERHHRVDVTVDRGRFSFDNAAELEDLIALGAAEARSKPHLDVILGRFLNGIPAPSFVPIDGADCKLDPPPSAGLWGGG